MKQLVWLALVLVLAGCAPAMNVSLVSENNPCRQAQEREIAFIERLDYGYGSGVFDETYYYSEGYMRVTWWGFQNMWWTSFESGGPLGDRCVVSRGST